MKKKPAKRLAEGGYLGKATVMGKDRVAPMVAADEMASGKYSSRRTSGGGSGSSSSSRGLGEKFVAGVNAFASGKSGQKRSMDDDAATRARNTAKKKR